MSRILKAFFFLGDTLLLNFSILLSFCFYRNRYISWESVDIIYLLVYSNLVWVFLVMLSTPYHINKWWSLSRILKNQMAFFLMHLFLVVFLNVFFKKDYGAMQIGLIYLIFLPLFFIWKIILLYFRRILTKRIQVRNYILIGKNDSAYQLRKHYLQNPEEGRRFCGYFAYTPEEPIIDQVQKFCSTEEIHEIYCCASEIRQDEFQKLVDFGLNSLVKVRLVAVPRVAQEKAIQLNQYDEIPDMNRMGIPLDIRKNQIIKRLFDVVFSLLVTLFILLWLVPLVGVFIKLDSAGSIFFSQRRSGKKNTIFRCFKFRTMHANAEADIKPWTKNDLRVTKVGSFLRKTSIDEFPQFINVLLGSMSVVGPRPHMLQETKEYEGLIKKFIGRSYIKPGITGLAQCLGNRGRKTGDLLKDLPDMENRVKIDFQYIHGWSFILDIKIIFLTIITLLKDDDGT